MIGRSGRFGLIALLLSAGCSVGSKVKNYAPAQGPAGAMLELELEGKRALIGELMAVADSSLLVQSGGRLHRVRLALIESGKAPSVRFTSAPLPPEVREHLRLISRYPQGISPELESRLLQAYGQTELEEPQ
ncbi:MAG TPA: hypothetical protein VJU17_05170 [Gemmatimonadales bacterium]|nr:hypothetical protein [Gemmatimonadales bacterium]